jgi:ABC-type nitrate/sulfonate/bicarbonate transport system permease component
MIAILPLMTLWFGYSGGARLSVVVFAASLTLTLSARNGARVGPARAARGGALVPREAAPRPLSG